LPLLGGGQAVVLLAFQRLTLSRKRVKFGLDRGGTRIGVERC
jgi:hypothetical protein